MDHVTEIALELTAIGVVEIKFFFFKDNWQVTARSGTWAAPQYYAAFGATATEAVENLRADVLAKVDL